MTKASDNAFPSILITEGTEPSAPAAGKQRVYIDSTTHHLKRTDSSGTDVDIETAASGAPADATYLTTSANGTLSAEVVVTAPSSGGIVPKVIRKTADETVNNSNTLQDDNHLLYALAASEVVEFECVIWYASGTTPDFKAAFTVPASADLYVGWGGSTNASDAVLGGGLSSGSGTSRDLQGGGASATDPNRVAIARGLVQNSTNAGNLQLQWAQNTANASDTIVFTNSTLKIWKLA